MGTELVKLEPIRPPDVRRPAKLRSLPAWVEQRFGYVKTELQPDSQGRYRNMPTVPKAAMLTDMERCLISKHVAGLGEALAMTPAAADAYAVEVATTVSKMLMVLPSKEAGDMANDAKSEAYMDALEDVPAWAVREAMRKWHRYDCGSEHDYRWQPGPATLRKAAMAEFYAVKYVRTRLERLLEAEPLREFSEDHTEAMKRRVEELGILPRSAQPTNSEARNSENVVNS